MENLPRGSGLLPLPPKLGDERPDFPHAAVFGSPAPETLPLEYKVGEPLIIKDQGGLDFCAGFAASEVSEDQELIELNPHFSFMIAKKLMNDDAWKSWGIDLRSMCDGAVKVGFIEERQFPFINDDRRNDRNFLADWENWPLEEMELLAESHKKESFWDAATGPYDLFDNIRAAMWAARQEARSVLTGCLWRNGSWVSSDAKGVIPKEYGPDGSGHAFKVLGWKQINGEPYLIIQNSWGSDVGDGGLFYFPREVVNKEFIYGSFTFRDMPKEEAVYYVDNGITVFDSLLQKLWKVLWTWLSSFFTHNT